MCVQRNACACKFQYVYNCVNLRLCNCKFCACIKIMCSCLCVHKQKRYLYSVSMCVCTHTYTYDIACTHSCFCTCALCECSTWGGAGRTSHGCALVRMSGWNEETCAPGLPRSPAPRRSPMTTALTVSRMNALRRRKRSTCSRVSVCRRRRVRSALCCAPSSSRCSQPTRTRRGPLSRRNRLLPWLLIVYLRGTEGPGPGEEEDRGQMWAEGKGLQGGGRW